MKSVHKELLRRVAAIACALAVVGLVFLFFTNDFGLVDLRKTSVVIGVGLDRSGDELELTAQLAVPQPAENGEKTQFNVVSGRGATVAEALNQINVRTGFYPKLVFCELILLGESCLSGDLFSTLDYFYRNEYTGLTPKIAACRGSAKDALSLKLPLGDSATDNIVRLLSEEAERSANICTVNLKDIGEDGYSESAFCYMPYIFPEEGEGGGQNQEEGGDSGQNSEQGSEQSGESGQGDGQGGADAQNSDGGQGGASFVCNRAALFSDGRFVGTLDERLTFAFNLVNSNVRHAFIRCGEGENLRVMGLRDCKGGRSVSIESGGAQLKLTFSAIVRVQDGESNPTPQTEGNKQALEREIADCRKRIEGDLEALFSRTEELGCDLFGVRNLLYKYSRAEYAASGGALAENVSLAVEVKLKSAA